MIARLYCRTGPLAGSEYQIDDEATIGRWEENDITLPPEEISGKHARVFFDDEAECYKLEDLDTNTGTRLDDTEVIEPVPLKDLHIITFGEAADFIFQAVDEETAASSVEEGGKTQFGMAPEPPSDVGEEAEPEGERTRFGEAPGTLPDLSGDEDAPEAGDDDSYEADRTRFGEAPPELPDFSEGDEETEEGERTQFGGAPGGLPDEEGEAEEDEQDTEDAGDRTQFGAPPSELPDVSEEGEGEDDRTQFGGAPGALPDLPEEDSGSEETEENDSADDRTQFGGAPADLPDFSEESDENESNADAADDRTRMAPDSPGLPDFSEGESSSAEEAGETESSGREAPQYEVEVIMDDELEGTYPLSVGEYTVGRSPDCDIQIEDSGVSREHARLVVEPDEVVVKDMGSKNFTFVDGDRLSGPTPLSPGSEIQFGLQVKAVLKHASS